MSQHPLVAELSPSGREFLARIGRRFGTRAVLAQAGHTLDALARHGDALREYGFGADEAKLLAAARDAAKARKRTQAKLTDAVYVHGLEEAKAARDQARLVLSSAYRRLRMFGSDEGQAVMAAILEVLTAISRPGGDDQVYARDLARLRELMNKPGIAAVVADSGGPEALALVRGALGTMHRLEAGLDVEVSPDDAESDAIDGMIVELARLAQFAARAVAKESGNRALAKDFRLRLMA